MNAIVADLMATPVVTVQRHHTVDHVKRLFTKHRFNAVPVVDSNDTVIGIVSAADLLNGAKLQSPVSSVMTRRVFQVPAYNGVHVAARIMRKNGIHHLVVTQEKQVVGILSAFDLLRLVENRRFVARAAPTKSKRSGDRQGEV